MQEMIQLVVEHEGLRWWFSLGQRQGDSQRPTVNAAPSTVDRRPLTSWLLHGPDAQLIPARPVVDGEPSAITVRRLKDWLTHWIYEEARRDVELDGVHWSIRREPGITVMSQARGERATLPPPAGLQFVSDTGDVVFVEGRFSGIRFVTMPQRELVRKLVEGLH